MKNFSKSIVSCISATVAIGISGVVGAILLTQNPLLHRASHLFHPL